MVFDFHLHKFMYTGVAHTHTHTHTHTASLHSTLPTCQYYLKVVLDKMKILKPWYKA